MRTMAGALPNPTVELSGFFRALADSTRLTIVRLLLESDLTAGEVVERVQVPQNTASYHLRQLRSVGLLRDRRSSRDGRDVYYSIDWERMQRLYTAAGDYLDLGTRPQAEPVRRPRPTPLRVLFLCTHNSARSQIAEGLLRHLGGDRVEAFSAGTEATRVHPLAIQMLQEVGADPGGLFSKTMDRYLGQSFDYVITVCDRARDRCPVFPGDPRRIHWSLRDPATVTDPDEQLHAFQTVRRELTTRIRYLLSLPDSGSESDGSARWP
jgi:protein-tyrosine-phosphatase